MSEYLTMEKEFITLYDLQSRLKEGVERLFPSKIWLRAEISAVKARVGGHCYMELSQSDENGIVAKAQAVVWSSKYRFIAPYFESVTGSPLREGMLVLVQVQVNFSQLYGLSLVVNDIDPAFSLGEQEKQRRLTLERLEKEGLVDMQQGLEMSGLPYMIAVISAADAAGYRDFMRHLHENEYGFVYHTDLFPALMQGADSPGSIIAAMDAVMESGREYDAVAIIRGGGARLDMACYDDYDLAAHIAQFPVPVFTAIGHDQDTHVADMVAFMSVKAPTALADEFVSAYADEDARLQSYADRLRLSASGRLYQEENRLQAIRHGVAAAFQKKIMSMENHLALLETRMRSSDPREILKKGYVLALDGAGTVLKSAAGKKKGDKVALLMADGRLDCTVDAVEPGTCGLERTIN